MAKLLTCEVALSDGTKQYYALESYVMQCLLKMAGKEVSYVSFGADALNDTVTNVNGVYYFPGATSGNAASLNGDLAPYIVIQRLGDLLDNPAKNAITATVINSTPTLIAQDCITVAPVIRIDGDVYSRLGTSLALFAYNDGELPTSSSASLSHAISVLHAHIRYRLAIMDNDKFKTLVEAWKTCIVKTLSGLPVTFSNEAVQ